MSETRKLLIEMFTEAVQLAQSSKQAIPGKKNAYYVTIQ